MATGNGNIRIIVWGDSVGPLLNRDVYNIESIGSYLYHKTDTSVKSK